MTLRELAEAATPGPREVVDLTQNLHPKDGLYIYAIQRPRHKHPDGYIEILRSKMLRPDAEFVAACFPAVILAFCDLRDAARALNRFVVLMQTASDYDMNDREDAEYDLQDALAALDAVLGEEKP